MLSNRDKKLIVWRVHLRSTPDIVYKMLSTDEGRAKFWASKSAEKNEIVEFTFPDGLKLSSRIIDNQPSSRFVVEYFGGSIVTVELENDRRGGTDLTLAAQKVR